MKYPQLEFLDDWTENWVLVGSRATCDPPPLGTDQDVLVLFKMQEVYEDFTCWLTDQDWESESDSYEDMDGEFESYRKELDGDEFNIIVTNSQQFFERFLKATWECKKANAMTKAERVAIFNPIMKSTEKKVEALENMAKLLQAEQQKLTNYYNSQLGACSISSASAQSVFWSSWPVTNGANNW